jgi:hypothetical protein
MKEQFSIQASTYTLNPSGKENEKSILGKRINYVIPIYQRPYSWTETQIEKFISDIFNSFWGHNKVTPPEPMFIGTMQLSKINEKGEQDIIDGQQRITTFLILLKILQLKHPTCIELNAIDLTWLSTEVNNGKQQENLNKLISLSNIQQENSKLNRYIHNAIRINYQIEDLIKPTSETHPKFNIDLFINHLFYQIYFVVIETRASLTKTLQIFDAINTTGLDLNAGDVFKIRMYEYLNPIGDNDVIFEEISSLYQKIDSYNDEHNEKVLEIKHILAIYQYFLISKYKLPTDLYTFGTDLFYDQLFETLFGINKWEHFKGNVENGKLKLSLNEISDLIDVRFEWERKWRKGEYGNALNASMIHLWKWSRYSKYQTFIYLYLNKHKEDENRYEMLYSFSNKLVKLYLFYSIYYQKSINNIKGPFNSELVKELVHGNDGSINNVIDKRMNSLTIESKTKFETLIKGDILFSRKVKNILCRLSALLEEDYLSNLPIDILNIKTKLFQSPIDIEHIQSYNDENQQEREIIQYEWGQDLNSLGNLVVLEQSINRSINNRKNEKLANYKKSKYAIVNTSLVGSYPGWNLLKCQTRRDSESKKIVEFIFNSK